MSTSDHAPAQGRTPSWQTGPRALFARAACALSALLGLVVLVGWALDLPALRSAIPGAVEMKANTALGLLAVSAALWLQLGSGQLLGRAPARLLATAPALLGAATLAEYAFALDLGIDEAVVRDSGAAFNQIKGRMSPYTALAFVALGGATLLLPQRRAAALVRAAAAVAAGIGVISFVGYLWNASEIVTDRVLPPVAINTACALMLLGTALYALGLPPLQEQGRHARTRLETLVLGGLVPTLLVVLVGGGLTYESGASFARTADLVAHTQEVRAEVGLLYGAVVDAELALFNQLLNGDQAAALEYEDRLAEASRRTLALRRLVADNPAQLQQQQGLAALVEAQVRALQNVRQTLRSEGVAAARERLALGSPEGLTQRIRALCRQMDATEAELLQSRLQLAREQRRLTLLLLLGTVAASALVFALLLRAIRREMQARAAAEDHLRQLNTQLQASNQQLEQARVDSEVASRAKSAFLANMSHEIRTPMNAIIGLTYLMLREATDAVPRQRLGQVGEAARHLLQVINDILDMSKIEAGKMSLEEAEFALDTLLTSATEMVGTRARDKGLELVVDTDHLPPRLVGDPTRLSQILINLLSNAVKFTASGWVRLRAEILQEQGARLLLRFEVKDTGPGIAPDRQAALFTAFEQADNSISRQHGGTGLGLALSREFARAMGGDAGVLSTPGEGSSFWFTAWLGRGREATEAVAAPVVLRGLRVLLVDDLPESLTVLADRLRAMDLLVDTCDSGPAALRQVQAVLAEGSGYDLLVADWQMEPMDGLETLRRLRELFGADMPAALLVTAFDDAALAERALAAGYGAVLLKPITASALQDGLAGLLRKQAVAARAAPELSEVEQRLRLAHAGQRVLLAEDNLVNREVAEELLRAVRLVVEAVGDGAHAVELALTRPYDLVLMDMQMPTMDGLDAARAIRRALGPALPIIAMTANAFADDREACLAAGMNDHVSKPVDPAWLYGRLLQWLPAARPPVASAPAVAMAGAADPDGLRQRLAGLAGLDIDVGLRNVGGRSAVLLRALQRFGQAYQAGLPELLDDAGPAPEVVARRLAICHSMRGALGLIGATQLLQQFTELERQLQQAAPPAALAAQASQAHEGMRALALQLQQRLD